MAKPTKAMREAAAALVGGTRAGFFSYYRTEWTEEDLVELVAQGMMNIAESWRAGTDGLPANPACELCGNGMASHMLQRVCPS